jgi:parallel beta-helix repeat protein
MAHVIRRNVMARIAILSALMGLGFLASARATTFLVEPDGAGEFPTIQSAMDVASYGDTVLVMPGVYHDCTHVDSHGRLCCVLLTPGVCLQSQTGQPADVMIDAQQLGRVIFSQFGDSLTIIRGFTVTGGLGGSFGLDRYGGGLLCEYTQTLIESCVLSGNSSYSGGGIACRSGSPTIRNCDFIGNTVDGDGAGIILLADSDPLIENCVFSDNDAAADGGAIYVTRSSGMVRGCLFTENRAGFWGAGIYCQSFSTPHVQDCTFCLNYCYSEGSGICASSGSSLTVERTIVAFNTGAPGVSTLLGGDASSIDVRCCDVFGNLENNYGGSMDDQTGLNDNISADPCFCDMANDDFTLWNYSPCAQAACGTIGARPVACWDAQEVVDSDASDAARLNLLRIDASPSPFSETTRIWSTSASHGLVRIAIFDMAGREVRSLEVDGTDHDSPLLTWDGRDHSGVLVPASVYWIRASQGDRRAAARVLVFR